MSTLIIALDTMVEALAESFSRANDSLKYIGIDKTENQSNPAALGNCDDPNHIRNDFLNDSLYSVPLTSFQRPRTIKLQAISFQAHCYPVFNVRDKQGTVHSMAISLSPPTFWRRFFQQKKTYQLSIEMDVKATSIKFQLLNPEKLFKVRPSQQDWIFWLSSEQQVVFRSALGQKSSHAKINKYLLKLVVLFVIAINSIKITATKKVQIN